MPPTVRRGVCLRSACHAPPTPVQTVWRIARKVVRPRCAGTVAPSRRNGDSGRLPFPPSCPTPENKDHCPDSGLATAIFQGGGLPFRGRTPSRNFRVGRVSWVGRVPETKVSHIKDQGLWSKRPWSLGQKTAVFWKCSAETPHPFALRTPVSAFGRVRPPVRLAVYCLAAREGPPPREASGICSIYSVCPSKE